MRHLSVCSGIEAASVAWRPMGWEAFAYAEIEAFPSAVLAHHYPHVPNLGDITKFKDWPDAAIDLLVGGTPCQSFSVAGLRKGMADPRGNLALTYLAIADRYRPEWLVWENVPGVLSSSGGRDFGAFIGGLAELGYGFAYRVLDAQFVRVDGFGRAVPQRRRRVFVIGNSRDWRRAAAVLFEPESLSGNPAPRREAGERPSPTISSRPTGGGGLGTDFDCDGGLIPETCGTLSDGAHMGGGLNGQDAYSGRIIPVAHALRADGFDASEDGTGRGTPLVPVVAKTLTRGAESSGKGGYAGRRQEDDDNIVAFAQNQLGEVRTGPIAGTVNTNSNASGRNTPMVAFAQNQRDEVREMAVAGALASEPGMKQQTYLQQGWAVRRLTPTECERLQGFPPGYTAVPYRGKPAADGPRYKALGNSMAVNCMRWIGRRIELVNEILEQKEAA